MPSGEVVAALVPLTTQKADPFHAIELQLDGDGSVRVVQVMPSGEVAAEVLANGTAQNKDPFQAIAFHISEDGNVRAVQVMPSEEVAAIVLD
jgi:hypothetical protein